jgi:hypothetical protein
MWMIPEYIRTVGREVAELKHTTERRQCAAFAFSKPVKQTDLQKSSVAISNEKNKKAAHGRVILTRRGSTLQNTSRFSATGTTG